MLGVFIWYSFEDDQLKISILLGNSLPLHCTSNQISSKWKANIDSPLVIFLDETNGNRSKLETYSFFLASLPKEEITKFSNINFVCVSNLLDSETLGKVIAQDLLGIRSTVIVY